MKKITRSIKKKHSVVTLLLRATWLCLLSFIILIAGVAIFLILLGLNGEEIVTRNDFIAGTWLDTFILIGLSLVCIHLFRQRKRQLARWSRKSLILLTPMIFVAAILTTALLLQSPNENFLAVDSAPPTNAVIGNNNYVEGLIFSNAKLLEYSNRERGGAGKNPLAMSEKLNSSAQRKCDDMIARNYWSHNDPNGKEPWMFYDMAGYTYDAAGENLAYGFMNESDAVTGWMNSQGHKDNLLNTEFTEVGYGTCISQDYVNKGPQLVVVQHLGKPKATTNTPAPNSQEASPQPKSSTQQPTYAECESIYQTYYKIPMISVGTKPTDTYLISYIGTDVYDWEVALYNANVAIYNGRWETNKSSYKKMANQKGCSTAINETFINKDRASPYSPL